VMSACRGGSRDLQEWKESGSRCQSKDFLTVALQLYDDALKQNRGNREAASLELKASLCPRYFSCKQIG
jgi:hypothetical protein